MANGAFSLGLADPNAILQQVYQQQQMQQPGAFGIPGVAAQPDYSAVQEYVARLAEGRSKTGGRKDTGVVQAGAGLDTPLQEPRYAFGQVIEDPRAGPRREALLETNKQFEGKEFSQSEFWATYSDTLRKRGDLGGALEALQVAGGYRQAEKKPTSREYAYKAGELKPIERQLPDGRVVTEQFQFWPELADQGYQADPNLPVGFIPYTGTEAPRKESAPAAIVNIGENELAKVSAKKVSEADEAANAARRANTSLRFLDKITEGLNTNQLSTAAAAAGNFGQLFGYTKDEIARLQTSKAVLSDLALTQMTKMKGNSSDKDVSFVVGSGPELNQTPEGRKFLTGFIKELNQREIERLQRMEEYISRPDNTQRTLWPSGKKSFNQEWDEYVAANPIVDKIKPPKSRIDTSKASKAFKDQSGNIWYEINGNIVNQFGEERK